MPDTFPICQVDGLSFVEEAPSRNGSGNQGKGYKSSKAEVKGCSASG